MVLISHSTGIKDFGEYFLLLANFEKQLRLIFKIILGVALAFGLTSLIDIIADLKHHAPWHHIWLEIIIFSASVLAILLIGFMVNRLNRISIYQIRNELNLAKSTANFWKKENEALVKSLALKIKAQFIEWGLTKSECEIGFLLLKGFSLKEIASLRKTSERTVREQAINIYSKAGLKSRVELTAFFLEDLLAPAE